LQSQRSILSYIVARIFIVIGIWSLWKFVGLSWKFHSIDFSAKMHFYSVLCTAASLLGVASTAKLSPGEISFHILIILLEWKIN
jgi:hypothetical protein